MRDCPNLRSLLRAGKKLLALTFIIICLPLAASADPITINTQKAWDNFVKGYDGAETVLILNCDITLEATGVLIDKFKGTLDGQGHSFIFMYEDKKDSAPFEDFEGTIKNLKLTGYIKYRYGYGSYRESVPLIRDLESTVVIENCLCDVQFTEMSSSGAAWNVAHIGGFIGQMTSSSGNATFRNCAFTGGFSYTDKGHTWKDTGGFVGYQNGGKITIENSLSCFTLQDGWDLDTSIDYFVGNPKEEDVTIKNSWGYCNIALGNKSGAQAASNTEIRSGEAAYYLNGQENRTGYWAQTIGTDGMPYLSYFFPNSKVVNLVGKNTFAATESQWATLYYPAGKVNLPSNVTAYTVSGVDGDKVVLTEHKASVTGVPVVLYCEDGISKFSLGYGYYNDPEFTGLLKGSTAAAEATDEQYTLQVSDDEVKFAKGAGEIPAWSCYMSADSLTLNNYYIEKSEQESNFGKNLLVNGGFDDGDNGWLLMSGSGTNRRVDVDSITPGIGNYLHTGKYGAIVYQDVDLTQYFRDTELDKLPKFYLSLDYCCTNYLTSEQVVVYFYDAYYTQLGEYTFLNTFNKDEVSAPAPWQTLQDFNYIPVGTRKIRITVNGGGTGPSGAASIDGPGFDNISLIVLANNQKWNTHKVTVINNTSNHATYRTGEYLEGTTVHIGTDHDCVNHDCHYYLAGYKINGEFEENPLPATTQRAVTIGTEDITYEARFARPEFSQASCAVLTDQTFKFKEPTIINLPQGYTGKPEYISSDPALATVDSETGKLTYVGFWNEKCIKITAVLPAQGTFLGDSISYYACFVNDYKDIKSTEDFNSLASEFKGKPVVARLCADITLGNKDYWDEFNGIFDGQGHTITVDYTTEGTTNVYNYAPFYRIVSGNAVFRNINIAGKAYVDDKFNDVAGLIDVTTLEADVVIENCNSSVEFTFDYNDNGFGNNHSAGFVSRVYCNLLMKDCSFTGSFKVKDVCQENSMAAFANYITNESNADFVNCFSDFSNCEDVKAKNDWRVFAYTDGGTDYDLTCSASNVYALQPGNTNGVDTYFKVATKEQVESGETAYLLNSGRTGDDAVWMQTIGTDATPRLRTFNPNSLEVLHANESDYTIGTAGWGTLYYPAATTLPEGVKAYYISELVTDSLVLEEIDTTAVSPYKPVIICTLDSGAVTAEPLAIQLSNTYYNKVDYTGEGMLKGVNGDTEAADGSYVLETRDGVAGFYRVDTGEAQTEVPAWQCYLVAPEGTAYSKIKLPGDDKATGIEAVKTNGSAKRSGAIYDLEGRKVTTLQKGQIYIQDGRKFIVK